MAITRQMAEMILAEHRFRPIQGEILLLGRQTVFMTPEEAQGLVERAGFKVRKEARIEYDKTTMGRQKNFISDASFFSLFADAETKACDVSDYEGAELIFDLSGALPAGMESRFDFIYNGSVLDNVFDPAACARNITRLLKPKGVVFHYEGLKHFGTTYLKFTPEWFFDYYALNGFADCQPYILSYHDYFGEYCVIEWDAFIMHGRKLEAPQAMRFIGEAMVAAIAEKAVDSTAERTPIQLAYRRHQEEYIAAFQRFATGMRRYSIRETLYPAGKMVQRAPLRSRFGTVWIRESAQRAFGHAPTPSIVLPEIPPSPPFAETEGHRYIGSVG